MGGVITALIGMLGGVAVGMQTPIANAIGQRIGGAGSSLVVHVSGTVFSLVLLAIYRGENIGNWRTLPLWTYIVGAFGVLLFVTINYTIPRLGTTAAISLIIMGQLTAGALIDQFGLFGVAVQPISTMKVAGLMLLLAGSYLVIR